MINYNRFFYTLALLLFFHVSSVSSQDTGVLVLAHGGSEEWNKAVIEAAKPLKKEHKVEVAFGMANYVTVHHGLKALEEQDISKIAVVQLFISSYSPIIRQNSYLLGKRDSLPERPMPLMHHIDEYKEMMGIEDDTAAHSSGNHRFYMPENMKPIPTETKIALAPPLDDHPIVAEILNKRIRELSTDPANETVLLVAHGPNAEDDNKKWIETMESLSQKIQAAKEKKEGIPYKQIFATTVRDDASDEIFNQAKANLRALVRQAGQFGDVIVVPLFLSSGGREQAVAERLEGLDFKWNGKTLLPDPLITDFLRQSVEEAFSQ